MRQDEYTIGEIAAVLGQPVERVILARSVLAVWPVRRDAAGVAFYDRAALSKWFRLLVERDASVLIEPDDAAYQRYTKQQLPGATFTRRPLSAEDQAFLDLLATGDDAAIEAALDQQIGKP